jgi:hypothetical protein
VELSISEGVNQMQLMGDAIAVFGSRLGIAWDPVKRISYLIRHTDHPGLPIYIHAGIQVGKRRLVLPLTPEGETFAFCDQTMTPTTMSLGAIDPVSGIHVKLTIRVPFRPRDIEFSTTPAVFFELKVDKILSTFRWEADPDPVTTGKVFLGFSAPGFEIGPSGRDLSVSYETHYIVPRELNPTEVTKPSQGKVILEGGRRQGTILDRFNISCHDLLVAISGKWSGNFLEETFTLKPGNQGPRLALAWCTYDPAIFNVLGETCPFKYTQYFRGLESVANWAREKENDVRVNSSRVDDLILSSNLGGSINHLLSQTLHTWLTDSWLVTRPNGQDWYTDWEGTCYFLSTTDVEYTMSPFYLSLWPELLEMELNQWSLFGRDAAASLGERGIGLIYLSHDIGLRCGCIGQMYEHDMEVEESANYLLMAYAHWRRTGRDQVIVEHQEFIRKLLDFIVACDTTGSGLPDKGCVNTIDDASPAIQYGTEQIYLGVKAMAACQVGTEMLEHAGQHSLERYIEFSKKALHTVESLGWMNDHYIVCLSKTMDGLIDPWSGTPLHGEMEGWGAYHIYTENGLALLDMIGYDSGLSQKRTHQDIEVSTQRTLGKYGSRHTSYVSEKLANVDIRAVAPSEVYAGIKTGWVSMNMLRDIAAAYRGIDLLALADLYWDWQCTTNSQEYTGFFETFYSNNLSFYPRGVAVFGYLDAAVGFAYDAVKAIKSFSPIRASLSVPLLLFADWKNGTAPIVRTELIDGKIKYKVNGL